MTRISTFICGIIMGGSGVSFDSPASTESAPTESASCRAVTVNDLDIRLERLESLVLAEHDDGQRPARRPEILRRSIRMDLEFRLVQPFVCEETEL